VPLLLFSGACHGDVNRMKRADFGRRQLDEETVSLALRMRESFSPLSMRECN
jgi:hypothetical protein